MPQTTTSSRAGNRRALLASVLALIILCLLGYSVVRAFVTEDAGLPERPKEFERCVFVVDENKRIETTRDMRLRHWELLNAVREEVVRDGKRGENGLSGCRKCHPFRKPFCYRCHEAASVKPDCWDCHYYPFEPLEDEATRTKETRVKTKSP